MRIISQKIHSTGSYFLDLLIIEFLFPGWVSSQWQKPIGEVFRQLHEVKRSSLLVSGGCSGDWSQPPLRRCWGQHMEVRQPARSEMMCQSRRELGMNSLPDKLCWALQLVDFPQTRQHPVEADHYNEGSGEGFLSFQAILGRYHLRESIWFGKYSHVARWRSYCLPICGSHPHSVWSR